MERFVTAGEASAKSLEEVVPEKARGGQNAGMLPANHCISFRRVIIPIAPIEENLAGTYYAGTVLAARFTDSATRMSVGSTFPKSPVFESGLGSPNAK